MEEIKIQSKANNLKKLKIDDDEKDTVESEQSIDFTTLLLPCNSFQETLNNTSSHFYVDVNKKVFGSWVR